MRKISSSLQVRLGIHTGLVVAGEMGSGEYREQLAIVGEAPNIAARLQEQAPRDTIVISAATYRLVRGLFECEALGPKSLRGISNPVSIYRVSHESEAQSRFDVAVQSGLTPLIGRESELGLLRERWARAKAGQGQVVLLGGEPGIGKSRLMQVLKESAAPEGSRWMECRSSPYHQNSASYPIIDFLQREFEFRQDDTNESRLRKIEEKLAQHNLVTDEIIPLFLAMLSLPASNLYPPLEMTSEKQREKTYQAVVSWMLAEAERNSLLLVCEDLHWSDPSTLEMLRMLIEQVPTNRLLLVLTHRPEFTSPWTTRSHFTTLTLSRLVATQSEVMVEKVTGGKALPAEVLQQIVAKTDGVPLFVEELTKMVIESGLVREHGDKYELTGPLPPLAIPSTLQDSLVARLDRLSNAREVAQLSAALGREFSHELLRAISPMNDQALQEALTRLVEAEVLFRRGTLPQARYFFKHALIQDAAYNSLLRSTRQQIHSRIAHALEGQFPDTAQTQPELVAHHYTEAGLGAQAIPYWERAGERALQRWANQEALSHLMQGLELLGPRPDALEQNHAVDEAQRYSLLLRLGEAQWRVGEFLKARETLLFAADAAHSLGSTENVVRAALGLVHITHLVSLPAPEAVRLLEEALPKLGVDDSQLKGRALGGLSRYLGVTGERQKLMIYAPQAVAMARRLGDPELIAYSLLGMFYTLAGPEHAEQRLAIATEMLDLAQTANATLEVAHVMFWRGYCLLELGDVTEADAQFEAYRRAGEETNQPFFLTLIEMARATRALMGGRFEESERLAQQAFAIGQRLQTETAAGVFGLQMFALRREQGRLKEVEPVIRVFVQQHYAAAAWRPGLAVIYSELGRTDDAREEFENLAQHEFADLPRDAVWIGTMTYLVDICTFLRDRVRAATLYQILLPLAGRNVVVGNCVTCYGALSRYLGALATTLERWDDAAHHFDDALTMNARMDALPWLAHTQEQYAGMLLARCQSNDRDKAAALLDAALVTARHLGMHSLEERITATLGQIKSDVH